MPTQDLRTPLAFFRACIWRHTEPAPAPTSGVAMSTTFAVLAVAAGGAGMWADSVGRRSLAIGLAALQVVFLIVCIGLAL